MKLPKFVKRFLPESAFAKNVSVLVGGTALGQVITVLLRRYLRGFTQQKISEFWQSTPQ